MDLNSLKQKALELKKKAVEITNKTITSTAQKLSESSFVLKDEKELDEFISKSENKSFLSKEGESKVFIKRVLVIYGDSKNDFFKDMLVYLPVLLTKSFSQNLSLKLVDSNNESIDLKKYDIDVLPTMIVYENKDVYKIISGEENIKKVVKSVSLDINKTIEEL